MHFNVRSELIFLFENFSWKFFIQFQNFSDDIHYCPSSAGILEQNMQWIFALKQKQFVFIDNGLKYCI